MTDHPQPFDLSRVKVLPLSRRKNLLQLEEVLVDPDSEPAPLDDAQARLVQQAADDLVHAREQGASAMLIYGAHLVKNGAARIVDCLLREGRLTHLATNGAGAIHDWEFAWQGASGESVKANVANGTFGIWDETATNIHIAILAGALGGLGFGQSMGKFMGDDGANLPTESELRQAIAASPENHLSPARAELLQTMIQQGLPAGTHSVAHRWRHGSMLACAYGHGIPATVHPGVGYDIISNHPIFNGAAIGRAAETDFKLFAGSVARLEGGVVLNVGSAIMGPQVFEKTLSCVNNVRLQAGQKVISGHTIYVVDIQDGGHWDWTQGEPSIDHPAYYLRFCKSYSRMGGTMRYVQLDNVQFMHHLWHRLRTC